jgi:hypothetical protein
VKVCSTCKQSLPLEAFHRKAKAADGRNCYCKPCAVDRANAWQLAHKDRRDANYDKWHAKNKRQINARKSAYTLARVNRDPEFKQKVRARQHLNTAVRRGQLVKPSDCSVCNESFPLSAIQGHHDDHSKPLEVVWCCEKCHKAIHGKRHRLPVATPPESRATA